MRSIVIVTFQGYGGIILLCTSCGLTRSSRSTHLPCACHYSCHSGYSIVRNRCWFSGPSDTHQQNGSKQITPCLPDCTVHCFSLSLPACLSVSVSLCCACMYLSMFTCVWVFRGGNVPLNPELPAMASFSSQHALGSCVSGSTSWVPH